MLSIGSAKHPLYRSKACKLLVLLNDILLYSYIRKSISQVYKPTIGADFHSKKLEIVEGDETKTVTL